VAFEDADGTGRLRVDQSMRQEGTESDQNYP